MKKNLLCITTLVIGGAFSSDAQVLFYEDFQSEAMPASFTITDVDGQTPNDNVDWATDAWVVLEESEGSFVAASTSWYSPPGISDDWMATSAITLGASGNLLSWAARALDPGFPDGYEVWVSTAGPTPDSLQNGTQIFGIAAELDERTVRTVSLDAFAGQTVYIGWRNNSNDKYILLVDDIQVTILPSLDAELTNITNDRLEIAPADITITGTVTNTGQDPITSLTMNYDVGSGPVSETFTVNIASLATYTYSFATPLAITVGNAYDVTVTITDVNGVADDNPNNNAITAPISSLSFEPARVVVGEEGTGTWCGFCPRGWDYMEYMDATYSAGWAGIAVHNDDPMVATNYNAAMSATIGGYPSGHVDRAPEWSDIDPSAFESAYIERINVLSPAAVHVVVTPNGNTYNINVTADFAATVSGDYRLNCVVTENGVTGSGPGWSQTNYYNGSPDPLPGWGENWNTAGDPVSDLTFNHVARAILGGWSGESGSVPATVNAGEQHSHTFSYTIPSGSNAANMHVVGMLIDQSTGEIINAGKADLTVGIEDPVADFSVEVFPNPTATIANVRLSLSKASKVSLEVIDLAGKTVASRNYGSLIGTQMFPINGNNLEAGIYFVNVIVGNKKTTKKVTFTK